MITEGSQTAGSRGVVELKYKCISFVSSGQGFSDNDNRYEKQEI